MLDVEFGSDLTLLLHFHKRLDSQYGAIRDARAIHAPGSPVFALEHDLDSRDLGLLKGTVRDSLKANSPLRYRKMWLPFIAYASEIGYGYAGDEYWNTFSAEIPRWTNREHSTIREWFEKFHDLYGGIRPTGAWARQFSVISWPITHAVLPVYLQKNLVRLLYDFSGALSADLLKDPTSLGERLALRATNYPERFRIFCSNTELLGQVAAALLSGENEETPYLTSATLDRIVRSVSAERQTRQWLTRARAKATRVRGFRPNRPESKPSTPSSRRLPRSTDPRLVLRNSGLWKAFVELPDLTLLAASSPEVYQSLRTSRARVDGASRDVPVSGLLYSGQEVQLSRWPQPNHRFIQLRHVDERTNNLLADQCVITQGPWWLFRRQAQNEAVEVKGKFVRPGHHYVVVGDSQLNIPKLPKCVETDLTAKGVKAYEFTAPARISEEDKEQYELYGLSVVSNVAIRPVGLVASYWDGEGEAEWLAGEPAMLGIHTDLSPSRVMVRTDNEVFFLSWPPGESNLIFELSELEVGTHELAVSLLGNGDRLLTSGSMIATIRDPQVRPESATAAEGIRMLASPARPTLGELWNGQASVTIAGPYGASASLRIQFRKANGEVEEEFRRQAPLPFTHVDWQRMVDSMRRDTGFRDAHDAAESCVLAVDYRGVGFASLTCERGFQALRWQFTRTHDQQTIARLIDRTDRGRTTLTYFETETPLRGTVKNPIEPFTVPAHGGLVVAQADGVKASIVLPADPNALWRSQRTPSIPNQTRSIESIRKLIAAHHLWNSAELPADPFAEHRQQTACDAISRAIAVLIGGKGWEVVETKLFRAEDASDHLDGMQAAVGSQIEQRKLASTIAYSLYKWLNPVELLTGFHEAITPHLNGYGIKHKNVAPRFLLLLAGHAGEISEWEPEVASYLIERVMEAPMVYRAARFAVLGTRALNDSANANRSF